MGGAEDRSRSPRDLAILPGAEVTEAELLAEVLHLCMNRPGLLVFHVADSRRDTGPGFPDLVLVGPRGILFRELKSASGQLSSAQITWRYTLLASGADFDVWRPADLASGAIERAVAAIA